MRSQSSIPTGLLQLSWPHAVPGAAAHGLVLLLYLAAAALTLVAGLDRPEGWSVWPAASLGLGIGIGAVCRCGPGILPTVTAGAVTANLLSGVPAVEAVGVAVAQLLMITAAIMLMRRMAFTADLGRFRDFLILVLMGPGLVALVSGVSAVVLHHGLDGASPGTVGRSWLAMATGCMLMAPIVLMAQPQWRQSRAGGISPAGYAMITVLLVLMVASQMRGLPPELTTSISYAVLVIAAIIAMFNSTRTVAIAVALAGFTGAVTASFSFALFDHAADADERLLVLIKLCLLAFVALAVSAVRTEHQRLSRQDSERLHKIARSGERQAREDAETRIAGELNQPLTVIRTYAQAAARQLARDGAGAGHDSLRRALEGIVTGTERAARTVRPEHGRASLPQTDVEPFLRQILDEAHWELSSRRIRLRESIDPDIRPVLVSEAELERVVLLALHISIELAADSDLARGRGRNLQLLCCNDEENGLVLVEFRIDAGARRRDAESVGTRDWKGWIERLDRFESEGGYFSVREEQSQQVIRIGLPAAIDAK